jgi:hypothetical protein
LPIDKVHDLVLVIKELHLLYVSNHKLARIGEKYLN